MSESAPETGNQPVAPPAEPQGQPGQQPPETGNQPPQEPQTPPAEDFEAKWKAQQKVNRDLERKLEQARTASMNETEKAVHEAEQRGRTAANQEFGQRLATSEFNALAARRNPEFKTADVLEYVDMSKMVGEDGEPDMKALTAAVTRLVPEAKSGSPDFGGGTRTPGTPPKDMNNLIRRGAGIAT
jgi:hypothetical protein